MLVTDFAAPGLDLASVLGELPAADRASLTRVITRRNVASAPAGLAAELLDAAGSVPDAAQPEDACLSFTTTGTTGEPRRGAGGGVDGNAGMRAVAFVLLHPGRSLDEPALLAVKTFPGDSPPITKAMFRRIIGLRYRLPLAHLQLARLLAERGHAADAARALRTALRQRPGLADAVAAWRHVERLFGRQ